MHKELAGCINLEGVAKELNYHAGNSVHFPPKKEWPVFYFINTRTIFFFGGGGGRREEGYPILRYVYG